MPPSLPSSQLVFPAFRRAFLERSLIEKNTKSIQTLLPAFVSCSQNFLERAYKGLHIEIKRGPKPEGYPGIQALAAPRIVSIFGHHFRPFVTRSSRYNAKYNPSATHFPNCDQRHNLCCQGLPVVPTCIEACRFNTRCSPIGAFSKPDSHRALPLVRRASAARARASAWSAACAHRLHTDSVPSPRRSAQPPYAPQATGQNITDCRHSLTPC